MTQVIQFPSERCRKTANSPRGAGGVFELPLLQGISSKDAQFVRRVAVILANATCANSGKKVGRVQAFTHARNLVAQVRQAR